MKKIIIIIFLLISIKAYCQTNHYLAFGTKETISLKSEYTFSNLFAVSPSDNLTLFYLGYIFNIKNSYLSLNVNSGLFSEDQYSQSSLDINYAYAVFTKDKNNITFKLQPLVGIGYTSDYVRGKGLNNDFIELRNNLTKYQYGIGSMFIDKNGVFAGVNIYHILSNSTNWKNLTSNKNLDNSYNLNQLQFDFRLGFSIR